MEFNQLVKEAEKLVKMQGAEGNWNYDSYMHGLFNGMEMITAMVSNRDLALRDAPKEWLCNNPSEPKIKHLGMPKN